MASLKTHVEALRDRHLAIKAAIAQTRNMVAGIRHSCQDTEVWVEKIEGDLDAFGYFADCFCETEHNLDRVAVAMDEATRCVDSRLDDIGIILADATDDDAQVARLIGVEPEEAEESGPYLITNNGVKLADTSPSVSPDDDDLPSWFFDNDPAAEPGVPPADPT